MAVRIEPAGRLRGGFALKFYTSAGNYDMVGNNTPVFFVRDPDAHHARLGVNWPGPD